MVSWKRRIYATCFYGLFPIVCVCVCTCRRCRFCCPSAYYQDGSAHVGCFTNFRARVFRPCVLVCGLWSEYLYRYTSCLDDLSFPLSFRRSGLLIGKFHEENSIFQARCIFIYGRGFENFINMHVGSSYSSFRLKLM